MKLINVLYRGGGGGEFLGSLLTQHKDVVTKKVEHDESVERWFLERNDKISTHYMDGSQPISGKDWDDNLWNIRLDHGYGFHVHREYYQNYLWNDWAETKTILLQPRSENSVKYIDQLARVKLGLGSVDNPARNDLGEWMLKQGFDADKFWYQPWKSCQELTILYKDMIPSGHDYIEIDPCELFHKSRVRCDFALNGLIDYLEFDDYMMDEWILKIDKYRVNNKKLINNTIV